MLRNGAKREQCWRTIRELDLPLPDLLPQEIAGRSSASTGRVEDGDQVTGDDLGTWMLGGKLMAPLGSWSMAGDVERGI
jgi:hypothetical protein